MPDYYKTGFEEIRSSRKKELERMMSSIGIVGVLEILSEISEDHADFFEKSSESSSNVAFWSRAAAVTKNLSEELWRESKK
jgi:hypothetical protein